MANHHADLRILMVSAYYRDNEPGGIATGIHFSSPQQGHLFCALMERALGEYDVSMTREQAHRDLTELSPRRSSLAHAEIAHAIMCVHWLQRRNHLVVDEFNGTIFGALYKDNLISTENSPLVLDLDAEMRGPAAADVTDIVRAGQRTLDGGVQAIRATCDALRGRR